MLSVSVFLGPLIGNAQILIIIIIMLTASKNAIIGVDLNFSFLMLLKGAIIVAGIFYFSSANLKLKRSQSCSKNPENQMCVQTLEAKKQKTKT